MTENEIGKIVVDAAIAVHRALGPGLLDNETRHNQGSKQSGGIILASSRLGARHYGVENSWEINAFKDERN